MPLRLTFTTLICMFSLLASATGASVSAGSTAGLTAHAGPRQAVALWLSQQLNQPVEASQILVAPEATQFDGCSISRVRTTPIGATALSLHCPAPLLPQLVLLDFSVAPPVRPAGSSHRTSNRASNNVSNHATPLTTFIVRAGAALNADWRTDSLHAQLPVVALDNGAAGAEIRVRIARTNRTMRARILSAHTVAIVNPAASAEHPL